ncbi:MAG: PilZ domain-containing protein [Candidatus Omnitrophica bacterium]|nr:PilZ domain-containing protein [Candidatus Omnitrophota bacterium]
MTIEKREFHRISIACKIAIVFNDSRLVVNAHTENISAGGIMLILESGAQPLVSALVDLDLFLWNDKEPLKSKAELMWLNEITPVEVKPRLFNVGLQFVVISDSDKAKIKNFVNGVISSWQ